MSRSEEIVVGLDVGTTKICTIIGEVNADGMVDVIGVGTASSRGLRRGVVINIDQTVASIRKAVSDAELMAGCQVESVFAGISGGHIKGINSHGVIAIKNKEVTTVEVARVIDAAKAVAIPLDREVIHILPQEFMVDTQDGIKERRKTDEEFSSPYESAIGRRIEILKSKLDSGSPKVTQG